MDSTRSGRSSPTCGSAGCTASGSSTIGVAVFGQDPRLPIRKFAERDYSTITHWSEFDRGGHFAAMEQPELYVGDLRTFVGSLDGR